MDTLTKSCSPTIVITANGEVQTHEEAIVYVKELDIFLTMKVLDNTPAVLSLGKLCDENGYSYEWISVLCWYASKAGMSDDVRRIGFRPDAPSGHYRRHLDSVLDFAERQSSFTSCWW